jgi:hypothetical protein
VGVEPLVDLPPARLGESIRHPADDLVHDLRRQVLEIVLRKTVRVYKPSLSFLSVVVGLATRHASWEAIGVPRPIKVERRRQKPQSLI